MFPELFVPSRNTLYDCRFMGVNWMSQSKNICPSAPARSRKRMFTNLNRFSACKRT